MTPERLRRIRTVYEAVVAKDTAERTAFVEVQCLDDEELRSEVNLLLAARDRVPDWLNEPVLAAAKVIAELPVDPAAEMEGRQMGSYRLLRQVGRGGMGSVYLAERTDGAFQMHVAIKLLQPGTNSAEIVERFRREREILASLDRPNIARLIDGGTTREGLPYFVMEFVEGLPITQWCDDRRLNVSQRLELFRGVCAAVHYAHQRLVVHRDLKPGNIFVTADGTVKLLDFGIAKLLNPEKSAEAAATRTLQQMMTPEYASPEQVHGDTITTLTDVYSLGVVLYELLTGHRPYRLTSAALMEMARVISEQEPTRPSLVVATTEDNLIPDGKETITPETVSRVREGDPDHLQKRLQGDLDCILLTALHKEPARRYSSAEAFGGDLLRHLDNLPVQAREDTAWYRVSRFIRRNRAAVAAGVLLVTSMMAGVFTTLWEAHVAMGIARQQLPAHAILAPQMMSFLYVVLAGFGIAAYLTRATRTRLIGSLAGGVVFALAWMVRWEIGYALGWWRSRFEDIPDPTQLFSAPLVILGIALGGAVFLLGSWRVTRRFGWAGNVAFVALLSVHFAVRDRFLWDRFMQILVATPGVVPVAADAAIMAAGLTVGYLVMEVTAGPARADALARPRTAARSKL